MQSTPDRRKTALITGASFGIGKCFAAEFAARGWNIVAVARREAPLTAVAEALCAAHGVDVTVLPADLSDPETPDRLFAEMASREIAIDALVNNAGFGVPGHLCANEWERHRVCIEVMSVAPVHLCHLFAPAMMKRRQGWIVNVSSLSALLPPHAGGTLYYPVKSFLLQFSLAMREELRASGVTVTALCPGFTETNFQVAAGGTVESVSFPRALWTSPEMVAAAGLRAVERNKAICIPGAVNKAIAVLFKLLPGPVARKLVRGGG